MGLITVQIDAERIALLRELLTARGWPAHTTPAAILEGGQSCCSSKATTRPTKP